MPCTHGSGCSLPTFSIRSLTILPETGLRDAPGNEEAPGGGRTAASRFAARIFFAPERSSPIRKRASGTAAGGGCLPRNRKHSHKSHENLPSIFSQEVESPCLSGHYSGI